MIVFQDDPDPIFLAIVEKALTYVRAVYLIGYQEDYRPTRAQRDELDESYGDLFPELVAFFTRRQLVRVIDRMLRASRDVRRQYELTDYHWLVLHSCLQVYCDLHNDGATGSGDRVGPYEIEHIDFDRIVDRFFFDTDFLMGPTLLSAEEAAPGQLLVTRQAWKIAAKLRPEVDDLKLTRAEPTQDPEVYPESARQVPLSGYVGPYPLREPADDESGR